MHFATDTKPQKDYSSIVNPECGVWHVKDLSTVELEVVTENNTGYVGPNQPKHLQVSIGKPALYSNLYSSFVLKLWQVLSKCLQWSSSVRDGGVLVINQKAYLARGLRLNSWLWNPLSRKRRAQNRSRPKQTQRREKKNGFLSTTTTMKSNPFKSHCYRKQSVFSHRNQKKLDWNGMLIQPKKFSEQTITNLVDVLIKTDLWRFSFSVFWSEVLAPQLVLNGWLWRTGWRNLVPGRPGSFLEQPTERIGYN